MLAQVKNINYQIKPSEVTALLRIVSTAAHCQHCFVITSVANNFLNFSSKKALPSLLFLRFDQLDNYMHLFHVIVLWYTQPHQSCEYR